MKVTVAKKQDEVKPQFPNLYQDINSELIVLFTSISRGIRIVHPSGTISLSGNEDWMPCTAKDHWEEFNGSITLEN